MLSALRHSAGGIVPVGLGFFLSVVSEEQAWNALINPLLIKPGQSVGYGMTLEDIYSLPYSRALAMVEYLGDSWDREKAEYDKAKTKGKRR